MKKSQKNGIDVWCGMILGFDNDGSDIVEMQRVFLQDNNILHAKRRLLEVQINSTSKRAKAELPVNDGDGFQLSLSDEHAIERIVVFGREGRGSDRLGNTDR